MKIFLPPPSPKSILIPFYNLQEKGSALCRSIGFRTQMTEKLRPIKELGVSEKQLSVCRRGITFFPKKHWDILTQGLYTLLKSAPKASPDHIGIFINCAYDLYTMGFCNYQDMVSLARGQANAINNNETPVKIRRDFGLVYIYFL